MALRTLGPSLCRSLQAKKSRALTLAFSRPLPTLTAFYPSSFSHRSFERFAASSSAYGVRHLSHRHYATSRSLADEKMEEIQDQYATAKDEFEIASEETEKKTVYAADDRAAAQEELQKLKELYEDAVSTSPPEVGVEIQKRVGQRIRELENAVQALERAAIED